MPRGRYLVAGRSEAFSCAPGPAGWRFTSRWADEGAPPGALDLVCDSTFRPVRFSFTAGGAWVRGGGLRLDDGTGVLEWAHSRAPDDVRRGVVPAVLSSSVGSLVALLRQVAGSGRGSATADLAVLTVDDASLAVLTARRRVSRVDASEHAAPDGELLVETWHVDDPDTGRRRVVHLAGDVVLAAEGGDEPDVELAELESPPWPVPARDW